MRVRIIELSGQKEKKERKLFAKSWIENYEWPTI